jgi:chromosome partitioning protein
MPKPRTIAIAAQKGGVAKTTSTINLGAELAALGQRVLLVDIDPQGHLAEGFGIVADELPKDISMVMSDHLEATMPEVIITVAENLDIAPSNIFLSDLELEMVSMVRREDRLKQALESVQDRYDIILIDCPPSLGILTVNAFSAADEVVVPMACEFYALLGVAQLQKSVLKMRRVLNPRLTISGILPTRNRRTRHGLDVLERAKEEFHDITVYEPAIPELVAVANASAEGKPLIVFAPASPARLAYETIAKEILHNGSQ